MIDEQADRDLAAMGLQGAPRFSVPMPLNTLLWQVVAMTPDGYVIADRSLVADRGAMHFQGYKSNTQALAQAKGIEAVQQLAWFNHGFMRAQVVGSELVLSDLRMGLEPDYNFSFVVATHQDGQWRAIPPRQVKGAYRAPAMRDGLGNALRQLWLRIWNPPGNIAPGTTIPKP